MKALSHQRPYKRAVPSETHDPFDRYADGWVEMKNAPKGASLLGAWRRRSPPYLYLIEPFYKVKSLI